MTFAANLALTDTAVRGNLGSTSVSYTPDGGSAETVTGMFDAVHQYVLDGIESVGPVLFLDPENVALLSVDPRDDAPAIVIGTDNYTVWQRQPDGAGGISLFLSLVTV